MLAVMVLQYVATHAHDHCRVLRQRFDALGVAPPDTPSLRLSEVAAGLTRREAARLFYQICSTTLPRMYLISALHAKEPLNTTCANLRRTTTIRARMLAVVHDCMLCCVWLTS